ncbi:lipoyl(octanoyl) transferase LipB [Planctomycetales bacterium ZRK34]|nr:lipoyl(octanoyl) transferase LipB [Planctomycetales bacterium ZRK34]
MSQSTNRPSRLQVIDLGRIAYAKAFDVQRQWHAQVLADEAPPTLLLLEHDPVITISRRDAAASHLIAGADTLAAMGVEVQPTDRGGDITYHGPGQLVVYPILPLQHFERNIRQYIRDLEKVIITTLGQYAIDSHRDAEAVGVWVDPVDGPSAKIAAIGVRVRRWVTMHGLALNVTTNLDHFDLIVPCGLHRPVTSMQQQLGDQCPPMQAVKDTMVAAFKEIFF